MFTRVVEITSKTGKANEVANAIHEKVLPIRKQQNGFLDELVLTSETEPDQVISVSLWKTREDAERYHREQYSRISDMLSHLLNQPPQVRTFNVYTSTTHRIAAGKAA